MGVDGVILGNADAVVHWRERQHLNPVIDALYPFDTLHRVLGIALERWASYTPYQGDGVPVHAVFEVIENAVIWQHYQFVSHFLRDPVLSRSARLHGPVGPLIMLSSGQN